LGEFAAIEEYGSIKKTPRPSTPTPILCHIAPWNLALIMTGSSLWLK